MTSHQPPASSRPSDVTKINLREDNMNEQTPTLVDDVMTIGVPVSDQDQALEFYLDKLGLEKRRDIAVQQFGGRWIEVAPPSAAVTIALVPTREGVATGVQTGIRLKTRDAVAVHPELQARAVEVRDVLRWPGVPPTVTLRDQGGPRLAL